MNENVISKTVKKLNTRGTKSKQGLNHLYVVVMTESDTLACSKIKSKLR